MFEHVLISSSKENLINYSSVISWQQSHRIPTTHIHAHCVWTSQDTEVNTISATTTHQLQTKPLEVMSNVTSTDTSAVNNQHFRRSEIHGQLYNIQDSILNSMSWETIDHNLASNLYHGSRVHDQGTSSHLLSQHTSNRLQIYSHLTTITTATSIINITTSKTQHKNCQIHNHTTQPLIHLNQPPETTQYPSY